VELGDPGLPHVVVTVGPGEALDKGKFRELGKALRYHPELIKGANVNFVRMLSPGCFEALTYERGVEDFTLACGTGCGSIAAVMAMKGLLPDSKAEIRMPGGDLTVDLTLDGQQVRDIYLTGPTCVVCHGEIVEG